LTATPNLPFRTYESQFMARSLSIYRNMVARFTEKRNRRGRVTRIGRTVPFTLKEFREWLALQLGGSSGVRKCEYCSTYVSAADLAVDHRTPPHRGGSLGFDNLAIVCKQSNDEKGSMTAAGYVAMRDWMLRNLDPDDCKDALHRLAISIQLVKQKQWDIIRKTKAQAKEQEEPF
jgi:5-methylcytosine-specific restriction endonuclease McrA